MCQKFYRYVLEWFYLTTHSIDRPRHTQMILRLVSIGYRQHWNLSVNAFSVVAILMSIKVLAFENKNM